jgi:hypothetical protein
LRDGNEPLLVRLEDLRHLFDRGIHLKRKIEEYRVGFFCSIRALLGSRGSSDHSTRH